MPPLVKIAIVFAFLIVLLRLKLGIGWVLLLAAALLTALFGAYVEVGRAVTGAKFLGYAVSLTVTILMLNTLGQVFAASGDTARLVVSLEHLLRDSRAALTLIPAFIGFLPMPGGAMLSAPPVREVGERIGLPEHDRVVINHWFRHVWEYISPLYPGVIVLMGFDWLKAGYGTVLLVNFPMTLLAIAIGVILYVLPVGRRPVELLPGRRLGHSLFDLARAVWPIVLVTVGAVVLGKQWIMPFLSLIIVLVALQGHLLATRSQRVLGVVFAAVFGGVSTVAALTGSDLWNIALAAPAAVLVAYVWRSVPHDLGAAFRHGFNYTMTMTVIGVSVFGAVVEGSGAAPAVAESLRALGLNPFLLLLFVPFVVGLLAGATLVYVSTTLPVLGAAGLITAGPTLLLAYGAGFMGVMLSPVHPCLVLTIDYFQAGFGATYRKLIPGVVAFIVGILLLAWLGWPTFLVGSP